VLYAIVLDFWRLALFSNHSAQKASGVEMRAKIAHFLTPCKNSRKLVERSVRIIRFVPHLGSMRLYTFYPATIGGFFTLRAGD